LIFSLILTKGEANKKWRWYSPSFIHIWFNL